MHILTKHLQVSPILFSCLPTRYIFLLFCFSSTFAIAPHYWINKLKPVSLRALKQQFAQSLRLNPSKIVRCHFHQKRQLSSRDNPWKDLLKESQKIFHDVGKNRKRFKIYCLVFWETEFEIEMRMKFCQILCSCKCFISLLWVWVCLWCCLKF